MKYLSIFMAALSLASASSSGIDGVQPTLANPAVYNIWAQQGTSFSTRCKNYHKCYEPNGKQNGADKVFVCHSTQSTSNPYTGLCIDDDALGAHVDNSSHPEFPNDTVFDYITNAYQYVGHTASANPQRNWHDIFPLNYGDGISVENTMFDCNCDAMSPSGQPEPPVTPPCHLIDGQGDTNYYSYDHNATTGTVTRCTPAFNCEENKMLDRASFVYAPSVASVRSNQIAATAQTETSPDGTWSIDLDGFHFTPFDSSKASRTFPLTCACPNCE